MSAIDEAGAVLEKNTKVANIRFSQGRRRQELMLYRVIELLVVHVTNRLFLQPH
jgi:hypothetical protein